MEPLGNWAVCEFKVDGETDGGGILLPWFVNTGSWTVPVAAVSVAAGATLAIQRHNNPFSIVSPPSRSIRGWTSPSLGMSEAIGDPRSCPRTSCAENQLIEGSRKCSDSSRTWITYSRRSFNHELSSRHGQVGERNEFPRAITPCASIG